MEIARKSGSMKDAASSSFVGAGGVGAKAGFLFALPLVPTVMRVSGVMEIFTHYGAMRAVHKLLTPLLRPLSGIPGRTGLALITDFTLFTLGARCAR